MDDYFKYIFSEKGVMGPHKSIKLWLLSGNHLEINKMIKVACKSSDSRCLFRQIIEFGMSCNSFLVSLRNKLFIIWENRRSDLTGPFSHSIHDYKISRHSSHGCIRTKIKRQLLAFSKLVSFLLLVSTFFRLSTFNTTFEFYHMIFFIFFFLDGVKITASKQLFLIACHVWVLLKCKVLTVDWLNLLWFHPTSWVLNMYPPLFQTTMLRGTKGMCMELPCQKQPQMPCLLPTASCSCQNATCSLTVKQIAAKHDCMHLVSWTAWDPYPPLTPFTHIGLILPSGEIWDTCSIWILLPCIQESIAYVVGELAFRWPKHCFLGCLYMKNSRIIQEK